MAKLNKITRNKVVSNFRQVTPVAGVGFSLLASAMNEAYDRVLPAAQEEMRRRGQEAGIEAAASFGGVDIEGGSRGSSYRDAIASIESRGSGNYRSVGARHKKLGRALGRYQIMEANLPKWSKEALGRTVSADEFLANDGIQDAIFDHKFGSYVDRFGEEGAAQAWFAGTGGVGKLNRKDVHGTTVSEYTRRFNKAMGRGKNSVNSGTVSTQSPTVTIRNSKGDLEQRLFSQFSGPTLQVYNVAAKTAYQAEVLNKASVDMMSISQSFPLDPDGFGRAAQEYVDQIVKDAPGELRGDIRAALSEEVTRRTMGVMSERQQDIENRANNSSRALVNRYEAELSDAIISGDEEQIAAAQLKLDDVLQVREALPGVAWTEEQSANVFLNAQRRADAEMDRRRTAVSTDTKSRLNFIIKSAKAGMTSEDEAILSDPDMTAIHPELAREAQAFVRMRDEMPEILQMTPDEMDAAIIQMKQADVSEDWQLDVIKAAEDVAKESRAAWDRDPVKRAMDTMPSPPPELPDLTSDDPTAFTEALQSRVERMDEIYDQGYTDTRAYLTDDEAEKMTALMNRETPPEIRAAVASAIVAGAGPAAPRVFSEIKGDRVTMLAGQRMALGGNPNVAMEMLNGQQIMDEGLVKPPKEDDFNTVFNNDFAEAFTGLPQGVQAQADITSAARAIYASRARKAELDKSGQKQLVQESLNAALGGDVSGRNDEPVGGVQDIWGHQTLLPTGVNGDRARRTIERAFGISRFSKAGGIKSGIADATTPPQVNAEAWEKAAMNASPVKTGAVSQFGRPIWYDKGEFFSEKSITLQGEDGKWYNIPTVAQHGRIMGDREARDRAFETGQAKDFLTGRDLPSFSTVEEAETAARDHSNSIDTSKLDIPKQGVPLYSGKPIPPHHVANGNLRIVAAAQNGYRMELWINGKSADIEDASGNVYFFDLQTLMDEGR